MRILVIDDDADTRDFLRLTLEEAGHQVVLANDGIEALKRANPYIGEPPRLVICDIFMPHKDGLETIREWRRQFPRMPIISMSGHAHFWNMLNVAKLLGATVTLDKPFQPAELLAAVDEAMRPKPCMDDERHELAQL